MRPLKQGIPKIVLVITDGASDNKAQTLTAAAEIKKREFSIISIGVGNINKEELLLMSSTGNDFYFVDNFDKILNIIQEIARTTCQQPAEVKQETNFVNEVAKDSYKYFKFPLVTKENNFTIQLKEINGTAELFYSFDDKTPKSDSDFVQNSDQSDIDENFSETNLKRIKRQSLETSVEEKSKYYSIVNKNNNETLYLGVKGVSDKLNKFQIYIYNRTIETILNSAESQLSTGSNLSTGSHLSAGSHISAGSILILIIGNIFMFKLFY